MTESRDFGTKTVWAHPVALPLTSWVTSVSLPLVSSSLKWVNSKTHFIAVGLTHVHTHTYTHTQITYNGAWYARTHLNSISPPATRSPHTARGPSNPYLLLLLPYLKLFLASAVPGPATKPLNTVYRIFHNRIPT